MIVLIIRVCMDRRVRIVLIIIIVNAFLVIGDRDVKLIQTSVQNKNFVKMVLYVLIRLQILSVDVYQDIGVEIVKQRLMSVRSIYYVRIMRFVQIRWLIISVVVSSNRMSIIGCFQVRIVSCSLSYVLEMRIVETALFVFRF